MATHPFTDGQLVAFMVLVIACYPFVTISTGLTLNNSILKWLLHFIVFIILILVFELIYVGFAPIPLDGFALFLKTSIFYPLNWI